MAVVITPKLSDEELVGRQRGTQRESIEGGVSLCVCLSYCCETFNFENDCSEYPLLFSVSRNHNYR